MSQCTTEGRGVERALGRFVPQVHRKSLQVPPFGMPCGVSGDVRRIQCGNAHVRGCGAWMRWNEECPWSRDAWDDDASAVHRGLLVRVWPRMGAVGEQDTCHGSWLKRAPRKGFHGGYRVVKVFFRCTGARVTSWALFESG